MAIARIHPDVVLDSRLALFHEGEGWLTVADLHYGYEQEFRQAGGLFPLWGNQKIEERLAELIADYSPQQLIILGDLVHGRASQRIVREFCARLEEIAPEVILIQGNHDVSLARHRPEMPEFHRCGHFFLHHGHLDLKAETGEIEITGHYHPAVKLSDGAGLRLKLPAFVQEQSEQGERWILPAFSPWAAGTPWKPLPSTETCRWACAPDRVIQIGGADSRLEFTL